MIKTLYILWFQGFDNSPDIVKKCVQSWKHYNPDWNIILLDNNNLQDYINFEEYPMLRKTSIHKCHLSDIVRVILLQKYGGCWTDSTTFCNKPLTEWSPNYIREGFFAFQKPGPDRLLSNWFLYADKDNYILDKWYEKTVEYYSKNNRAEKYLIHHYMFGNLYESDIIFKEMWDKVPKLQANGLGPHYIQEKGMFKILIERIKNDIDRKITPLYKLTYKCKFPEYDINLITYYLYTTIENI